MCMYVPVPTSWGFSLHSHWGTQHLPTISPSSHFSGTSESLPKPICFPRLLLLLLEGTLQWLTLHGMWSGSLLIAPKPRSLSTAFSEKKGQHFIGHLVSRPQKLKAMSALSVPCTVFLNNEVAGSFRVGGGFYRAWPHKCRSMFNPHPHARLFWLGMF